MSDHGGIFPTRGRWRKSTEDCVLLTRAEYDALVAERDRLAKALRKYGNHLRSCDVRLGSCTCGVLDALAGEEQT